jgi:glycosyltransferase involved in cell wall biosynthesis
MDIPTIRSYLTQMSVDMGTREGGLRTPFEFSETANLESPLVSIITIVLNGEATLERAMVSVLAQDYNNIEYIVVDGGSTDQTISIIKCYENQLAYWCSEPDAGISDAFNKGIALASGYIVGLLNSDDWYEPDAVAEAVRNILSNDADISHGNLQIWKQNVKDVFWGGSHELLKRYNAVNHPTVFVKRDVYARLGLFRPDYRCAMDYEWLLRAKMASARFSYIDKLLANMQHGGFSNKNWILGFRECARAKKMHLGTSYRHDFYLLFEVSKDAVRRVEEKIGISLLTWLYRKCFGLAKNI